MNIFVGTDIIEIDRIAKAVQDPKFVNRIFTTKEISYCEESHNMKFQHYGARFAAKEATYKAISGFISDSSKITWNNIEVTNDPNGKPLVNIINVQDKGLKGLKLDISLSHTKQYAIAYVIAYKN